MSRAKFWLVGALALLSIWLSGCEFPLLSDSNQAAIDQIVQVYFTDPFSLIGADRTSQVSTDSFEFRLRNIIRSAERSLDIAVYHITSPSVVQEINEACSRGIKVRILTESEIDRFSKECSAINVAQNEPLMHHKFMIVDNSALWTGSANWTLGGLEQDANDGLLFQSREIARIYRVEFEEMFLRERFGDRKRDQNEERVAVEDIAVEVYFSPSDSPRRRLLELIDAAQSSIKLSIYAFTDNDIYQALLDALERDVEIDAVWDFHSAEGCQFSEADEFSKMGIGVVEALPGLLHTKYAIIDESIVVTGSANWSRSGMERNDENILIVHSPDVAQSYIQNFGRIRSDADEFTGDDSAPPRLEVRHFDSLSEAALVQWRPHTLDVVESYEICRFSQLNQEECDKSTVIPGWAWFYVDTEVQSGVSYFYRARNLTGDGVSNWSNSYQTSLDGRTLPVVTAAQAETQIETLLSQELAVQYQVYEAFLSDAGNLFLNSREDHKTDFTAFIPACAIERFNGVAIDLFELGGQQIEVYGELIEFDGPEIVITSPWQLKLLEN